ncbi:MAG: lysylphosphatidylglycerol synthase transmembrane domain-containing protein [Chloroflexota bacterium]
MRVANWLRRPIVWAPISILLLALVAWRSRLWEAGALLGHVAVAPLVAALALSAVVPVLWAIRSSALLGRAGRPVGILPLIPMTAFANTINNLTPGSSGEIFRLWLLREHHAVDYTTGTAVVVVERIVTLLYLAGSAVLVWLAVVGALPPPVVGAAIVVLAALPGIVYGMGIRPSRIVALLPLGRVVGPERWSRTTDWLTGVDATITSLLTRPGPLATFAIASALVLACYTVQLVLVGQALGVSVSPAAAWGALGIGITVGALSLLPFGLGSTDLVVATLLTASGVPPVEATAMTFAYRLVSTLPLAIAGVASYAVLSAGLPAGSSPGSFMRGPATRGDAPPTEGDG